MSGLADHLRRRTAPSTVVALSRLQWPRRLRESAELEHVHWATTRAPRPPELLVLAMDHRGPLETLAA